jgi:hypothetical protein
LGTGGAQAAQAPPGERWSREPIDLSALRAVNAKVKLKSEALILDTLRLDRALIDASLTDGLLDLGKLAGTLYGGALSVSGKVDARQDLQAGLAVTAIEVDLGKLLRDLAKTDRVSGPLNLNAALTARGRSEAELVSALTGQGDFTGSLNVKAKAEEQVGAALLGILGQKIREIRGVTETTATLFNAFAGTPAALKGTFTAKNGILRTEDARLDGRNAVALTKGTADLPAWLLDSRTDLYRAENPDTPYVSANLQGPLDKPNVRISGQAFQRQQQVAPAPATSGPQPSGPQPSGTAPATQPAPIQQAPQQLKPEDIIKEGLKGLLKGLGN